MYHDEIVAVICDSNKKPLRELDSQRIPNGRKSKVFLPFNSEYMFLIKNNSDRRIKLAIDIDGTNVSANGLILKVGESDYIERFVDIAKKFLFVKASDERVGDPTNKENGVIKIRVRKERDAIKNPFIIEHHYHYDNVYGYPFGMRNPQPSTYPNNVWYSQTNDTLKSDSVIGSAGLASDAKPVSDFNSGVLRGLSSRRIDPSYNGGIVQPTSVLYSTQNCGYSIPAAAMESGATVEGAASDQKFETTYWNGDMDTETVFTFQLFATDDGQIKEKMEQFLKLKKELGL